MSDTSKSIFDLPTYLRKKPLYPADQPPQPQADEAPAHEELAQQQPPQRQSMPGQVKSYGKALLQRAQSSPQVPSPAQRNAAPQDPPPSHPDEPEAIRPATTGDQPNSRYLAEDRIPANTIPLRPKDSPPDYLRRLTEVGQPKGTLSKFLQLRPGPYSAATPPSYATPAATQAPDPTAAQPLPAVAVPHLETDAPNAPVMPPVTAQPALPDPEQLRQATIEENLKQREQASRQRQEQLRGQAAEHARQQTQQEAQLQPAQQRLEDARQAHAALADAPVRYEKRGGSLVSIQSDDSGAQTVLPVDPANPQEMQQAAAWMQQHDAAKSELAAAEAAHAPLAAGVQDLKDQGQKLVTKLVEDNRWQHSTDQKINHQTSGAEGPPPAFTPATADRRLLAQLQAEGHPMAAAVKEVMTPPAVRQFQDKLNTAATATPMTLMDVVTGGTPGSGAKATPAEATAARDLTMKSMGVMDPKNVQLTPLPDGTLALHRPRSGSSAPLAIYDPKQKSLTMQAQNGVLSEEARRMVRNIAGAPGSALESSMPVYFGHGPHATEAEFSSLVEAGKQAHEAARTPEERAAALDKLGLSPAGVKKQLAAGTLSFQQGRLLNGAFNGVMEHESTLPGTQAALEEWVSHPNNQHMAQWLHEGTPEQRAYVASQFFKQTSHRAGAASSPRRNAWKR